MTMIAQALNPQVSRRQLMVGAAGLTFAVALGGSDAGRAAAPGELSPWVTIAADGTITIRSPATEMGQGTMTSIPLIFAEELDADWSKVRVAPAPPVEATFGNPGFGGMMYTAGSNAVTSYYKPVRQFGALERRFPEGPMYYVASFLFGMIGPVLVLWFIVFPIKGIPMAAGWDINRMIVHLIIHGCFGLGVGVLLKWRAATTA